MASNGNPIISNVECQPDARPARKMDSVLRGLIPLEQQVEVTRFLNSAKDVRKLGSLVEDIHDIMMDYQVCLQSTCSRFA